MKIMNWNLFLLKLSIQKNQILLWESFTEINRCILSINIFLLEDFKVNLLNNNEHNQDNEILDSHASLPHLYQQFYNQPEYFTILILFWITYFQMLLISPDKIAGNLTTTISDHLPQFARIPNMFDNIISGNKSNVHERD